MEKSGLYLNGKVMHGRSASAGNARERAFLIIRDKIIYMDLKPGEALSDKVLAEQLEMSRTPVREALILLSAYNMVVLKPQSGTFVAPIDSAMLEIEQFSRLTMEKEIIKQACALRSEELKEAYESNIAEFDCIHGGDEAGRIRRLHDLDNRFHRLAFAATGKRRSFLHMHSYMQHIERLRVLTLMMDEDKNINQDHRNIACAVVAGDEKSAIAHLEDHLSVYLDSLKIAKNRYPEYFVLG